MSKVDGEREDRESLIPTEKPVSSMESLLSLGWTVYAPSTLYGLADGVALPIIPLFARHLGCAEAQVGLSGSSLSFGKFLADIPAGLFASAFGWKWTMVVGLVGYGCMNFLISLTTAFEVLFVLLVLSGGFAALYTVSRAAYLRTRITAEYRGRAISLVGGTNRFSRVIGPIFGGYVSATFGVNYPFVLSALLSFCGAAMLVVCMPADAVSQKSGGSGTSHGVGDLLLTLKRYKHAYLTAGIAVFCLSFCRSSRNMIVPVKGDNIGLSHDQIGLVMSAGYFIDTLLFAPVGYAMDVYGRRPVGIPAYAFFGFGLMLITVCNTLQQLLMPSVLIGIGNGLSSGLAQTLGADLSPSDTHSGAFLGVWSLIGDAGGLSGPLVTGIIEDAASFNTAILFAGFMGFLGFFWFSAFVKETLKSSSSSSNGGSSGAVP